MFRPLTNWGRVCICTPVTHLRQGVPDRVQREQMRGALRGQLWEAWNWGTVQRGSSWLSLGPAAGRAPWDCRGLRVCPRSVRAGLLGADAGSSLTMPVLLKTQNCVTVCHECSLEWCRTVSVHIVITAVHLTPGYTVPSLPSGDLLRAVAPAGGSRAGPSLPTHRPPPPLLHLAVSWRCRCAGGERARVFLRGRSRWPGTAVVK